MNREVRSYLFNASVQPSELGNTLFLAVLAAEGLHGQSRVRLEATYSLNKQGNTCAIDASNKIGSDISRIFTSFAIREYGEDGFFVLTIDHMPERNDEGLNE